MSKFRSSKTQLSSRSKTQLSSTLKTQVSASFGVQLHARPRAKRDSLQDRLAQFALAGLLILGSNAARAADVSTGDASPASSPSQASEAKTSTKDGASSVKVEARADKVSVSVQQAPLTHPKRADQSDIDKIKATLLPQLKKECNRHFPALIQTEIRAACISATDSYAEFGASVAGVKCRLVYGEDPRELYSCLIGVDIADEISTQHEEYKRRLQLCSDQYPAHTEIDSFLQESCLTGIYMPNLVGSHPTFETCAQISEERSFIGPCQVGFSLAKDLNSPASPNEQNHLCEQYFDHQQFHTGYRACLNGRGAAASGGSNSMSQLLQNCDVVASNAKNDTERAACLVGANIFQHLIKKDDVTKRFIKCGSNKVSYEDRDYLACLTAASAMDITNSKGDAESACKEIFHTASKKNSTRGDCLHALNLF